MIICNDLELGAPSQKVFSRKVRELLNLGVVWALCPLERSVGTFSASFIKGEVLDTFPILERGEFRPHGRFPVFIAESSDRMDWTPVVRA